MENRLWRALKRNSETLLCSVLAIGTPLKLEPTSVLSLLLR